MSAEVEAPTGTDPTACVSDTAAEAEPEVANADSVKAVPEIALAAAGDGSGDADGDADTGPDGDNGCKVQQDPLNQNCVDSTNPDDKLSATTNPLALRHERLQGTISKYVPSSGWGFVKSHMFEGEVGFKVESVMFECQSYEFREGESVEFDVQPDERGRPQAVSLKPMVGRKPNECQGQRLRGYVRRFADRWGFLNAASFDGDLFVHRDNLLLSPEQLQDGMLPLRAGQPVEFDVSVDDRGRTVAKQITTSALLRPVEWVGRRLQGYIRSFQGAWGFINSDRFAGDLFVHRDSLLPQFQGMELAIGSVVEFDVERDHHKKGGKSRLVARQVAVLNPHQGRGPPPPLQHQAPHPGGYPSAYHNHGPPQPGYGGPVPGDYGHYGPPQPPTPAYGPPQPGVPPYPWPPSNNWAPPSYAPVGHGPVPGSWPAPQQLPMGGPMPGQWPTAQPMPVGQPCVGQPAPYHPVQPLPCQQPQPCSGVVPYQQPQPGPTGMDPGSGNGVQPIIAPLSGSLTNLGHGEPGQPGEPQFLLLMITHDWEPDQPQSGGQLAVRRGTLVNVSHRAAHGWVYVAKVEPCGDTGVPVAEGWVPQAVTKRVHLCRATLDWPPDGCPGTLGLVKGDLVAISKDAERGWVYGERISPKNQDRPVDGWMPQKVLEYIIC